MNGRVKAISFVFIASKVVAAIATQTMTVTKTLPGPEFPLVRHHE